MLEIFEKITYSNTFEYLRPKKLISDNQPGFKSGGSYVNQIWIYCSLDNGLEIRCVFRDVSKASEKVWHEETLQQKNVKMNSGKLVTGPINENELQSRSS